MTGYDDNICQRISTTGHPSGIIINMEILVDVQPFVRLFVILSVQVGCCKSNQIESHSIKLLANCIHPSLLLLETLDNFRFPTFFAWRFWFFIHLVVDFLDVFVSGLVRFDSRIRMFALGFSKLKWQFH